MRNNARWKPGASWDPAVARRQIEERASSAYAKAIAKLCGIVKQDRKRSAAAAAEVERALLLFAESHPPEAWKNTPLASNLVAHPVRQGGLRAAAWAPPLQERAEEVMPVAMQSQLEHLAHWDQ